MTLCAPEDVDKSAYKIQKKASRQIDIGPNMVLDSELYEGIVSQPIIEPKVCFFTLTPPFFSFISDV